MENKIQQSALVAGELRDAVFDTARVDVLDGLTLISPPGDPILHYILRTDEAPEPGNYSQARVVVRRLADCFDVYCSGQTGDDPATGSVVEGGIKSQTRQALENIEAVLRTVGGNRAHIVKINVSICDMAANKAGFEEVYKGFFGNVLPARALVEVSDVPLPGDAAIVEIEATAVVPKRGSAQE